MTATRCPCGHALDSDRQCLNGRIYGPCGSEHCDGPCTDTYGYCNADVCACPRRTTMSDPNVLITLTANIHRGTPLEELRPPSGISQAEIEALKAGILRLGGVPTDEGREPQ